MNDNFRIIVEPDDVINFDDNKIKCLLYCQVGTIFFPDDIWDDYPLTVLSWWTEAVSRLLTNSTDQEEFCFKDSYHLKMHLQMKGSDICEMSCLSDYEKPVSFTTTLNNIAFEVFKASEKVINKCKHENWNSEDLIYLINNHTKLNDLLAKKWVSSLREGNKTPMGMR